MTGNAAVEARIADALATPGLHVIADHFPLMITVTHGDTDEAGLTRYMRELEAAYHRREPIVWLSIIVGTGKNREHIRRLGEWMKKNRPTIAAYGMATVFVTRSTVFRFVLSTLLLTSSIPNEYRVFSEADPAVAWLGRQARGAGIAIDDELASRWARALYA